MQAFAPGERDHAHSSPITTFSFTPGPWCIAGHRTIAADPTHGNIIAEVWSGGVGADQADANERLIAAAPALACLLAAVLASVAEGEAYMPHGLFKRMLNVLQGSVMRAEP